MIQTWMEVTIDALQGLWQGFVGFIPALLGAVIVFAIGWFVSIWAGKIITEILKRIKFNLVFEKGGWKAAMEKAEVKMDAAGFVGTIIKWVLIIVFLSAAIRILGIEAFDHFIAAIVGYLPNILVATLIFVVAVIVVDIVTKVVRAGVEGIKVGSGHLISAVVKWAIWIFASLAILHQLRVAPAFMETLFTGLVAVLVISFGIAFGLGGKDVAADLLQDLRKKLRG